MPVHQMLYVSGARPGVGVDDIGQILAASRRNNKALGVTGLLLVADQCFIQVLEGESAPLRRLVSKIKADPRHRNVMVLVERDSDDRAFSEWEMGFKRLDASLADEASVFRLSQAALSDRVAPGDGGLMLDTILAFAGGDFIDKKDPAHAPSF